MPGPPLKLWFPGPPVPKGRPRFSVVNGRAKPYTPAKTRAYEKRIAREARAFVSSPLDCPCELVLLFGYRSSLPDRKRSPRPGEWKSTGPDLDNLVKSVLDGMNGVVFEDDRLVVGLAAKKVRLPQGVEQGVYVLVYREPDLEEALSQWSQLLA